MKTVTKNNLSLYVFDDNKAVNITDNSIVVGDPVEFVIADCNSTNALLHENVTPPEDWSGCKYFYSSGVWTPNSDWVDPSLAL